MYLLSDQNFSSPKEAHYDRVMNVLYSTPSDWSTCLYILKNLLTLNRANYRGHGVRKQIKFANNPIVGIQCLSLPIKMNMNLQPTPC